MDNVILRATGISKSFSKVKVLKNVSFELKSGEVHVVMGENGAGKSTLMKILTGIYRQDDGNIYLKNDAGELEEVHFQNPKTALEHGISMVFQEFNLMDNMSIAENILMGYEPVKHGLIDWHVLENNAKKWMELVGLNVPPMTTVDRLSTAQKQCVEIAKCLSHHAKIIILDEPTSSLSEKEVRMLFDLIRKLKKNGISIIYISHRMEEIFELGDRVTVYRDGEYIGTVEVKNTNEDELIKMMVGRELQKNAFRNETRGNAVKDIAIEADGVVTCKYPNPISFVAYKSEIVGVFGLVGAGRTELARVLFGIDKSKTGCIKKDGKEIKLLSPSDAIKNRIGMVPEDRKGLGLILSQNIINNTTTVKLREMPYFLKSQKEELKIAEEYIKSLSIVTPSPKQLVERLSGGNQQKVAIAKWLCMNLDVLILDEPTRGVDVKAKAEIYDLMRLLADKGTCIIMISSDMPEVLRVSDRIVVMHDGKITLDGPAAEMSQEKLMAAAIR